MPEKSPEAARVFKMFWDPSTETLLLTGALLLAVVLSTASWYYPCIIESQENIVLQMSY